MITAEEIHPEHNNQQQQLRFDDRRGGHRDPPGAPPMKALASILLLGGLFALSSSPAVAYEVYDKTCATPGAGNQVWYINPGAATGSFGAGDSPDKAHGGTGTADGSEAHPFNSLQAVFTGGKVTPVAGYSRPMLSTAPYDHYGIGTGLGVHGQRKDDDWNPAAPNPTRINPGDEIALAPGQYGNLLIGYPGVGTYNVDTNGNTDFVIITGAPGWKSILPQIAIGSARGFVVRGLMAKSLLTIGPQNNKALLAITGSKSTPTQDIIVDGGEFESFTGWADMEAQWEVLGSAYATEQAFLNATLRNGIFIGGDDIPGVDNHCISVSDSNVQYVMGGAVDINSSKVLLFHNNINHFAEDGTDILASNFAAISNTYSDPFYINAVHPDTFQIQEGGSAPGPMTNVKLDRNTELERTDVSNPWPQQVTFFQGGAASGLVITNNLAEISNCPGIALGGGTQGAIIANNTIVNNGANTFGTCPQSGEAGTHIGNNLWVNNVVAGRFYQQCDGSVWENNIQIPARSGGKPIDEVSGICLNGKIIDEIKPGTYNGVTIYTTDLATFAFNSYDPPATGLSTTINLQPVRTGPLYGTGRMIAGIPTVNIEGKSRTPRVNIGAY
jgi:hypothetical protein